MSGLSVLSIIALNIISNLAFSLGESQISLNSLGENFIKLADKDLLKLRPNLKSIIENNLSVCCTNKSIVEPYPHILLPIRTSDSILSFSRFTPDFSNIRSALLFLNPFSVSNTQEI